MRAMRGRGSVQPRHPDEAWDLSRGNDSCPNSQRNAPGYQRRAMFGLACGCRYNTAPRLDGHHQSTPQRLRQRRPQAKLCKVLIAVLQNMRTGVERILVL